METLNGHDPPPIQLRERMERLWWQFSEAWKTKVHGRGGRTLSFGRSRRLTDFPKVVAYLSGPRNQEYQSEGAIA
eukprot:5151270-Alexandrium_andersonii.AAC.1